MAAACETGKYAAKANNLKTSSVKLNLACLFEFRASARWLSSCTFFYQLTRRRGWWMSKRRYLQICQSCFRHEPTLRGVLTFRTWIYFTFLRSIPIPYFEYQNVSPSTNSANHYDCLIENLKIKITGKMYRKLSYLGLIVFLYKFSKKGTKSKSKDVKNFP